MNTRRYSGCSCDAWPHTASSSAACVRTRFGMARHVDEEIELLRRQPDFAALRVDAPRVHVDPEVAGLERRRLRCAAAPPPRRSAARTRAISSSMPNGLVT